ncbi:MAG: carboxypeptidase-like regulatory domain-containing protein [Maribacter sp.]|nr:carboxypeptidase-like regulatory domain-containing protein [Maribacter sp.]
MKKIFILILCFFYLTVSAQNTASTIKGKVTLNGTPIYNANINLKDTKTGVNTNEKGEYVIQGNPGDVLVFTHMGLKTIEIVLEDVTTLLNVNMLPKEEQLNEVIVKKHKQRSPEERKLELAVNKDLIRTQYGILDSRKSGLSLQMINVDELPRSAPTFLEAIQGRFIGRITYGGTIFDEDRTKVYLRESKTLSGGSKAAVYDLDGLVLDNPPLFLSMQDIDRIAIIRGIGASNRYGRRGHGGVIVINTKQGNYIDPEATQKFKDSIALRKKRALEAFKTASWDTEVPHNLKNLYDADSEEKASQVNEKLEANFDISPYEAIASGTYFFKKWKNKGKAEEIWNSVKTNYSSNAPVLKALAYSYEEIGDLQAAMQLYQAIASLRPNYAQSYRDLANINTNLGNHGKALNLYARQLLDRAAIRQTAMDSIINIESHNLIARHKMEMSSQVIDIEQVLGYSPIRLLLEWNNGEAEFDVQCMYPPNYYTWRHTFNRNPESITDEKTQGYSSKQFFINEDLGGEWRFNLKYFGNKSLDPTYLKVTVYFDYGKPSQRKELKVYRLQKENINRHLLTIDTVSKAISS